MESTEPSKSCIESMSALTEIAQSGNDQSLAPSGNCSIGGARPEATDPLSGTSVTTSSITGVHLAFIEIPPSSQSHISKTEGTTASRAKISASSLQKQDREELRLTRLIHMLLEKMNNVFDWTHGRRFEEHIEVFKKFRDVLNRKVNIDLYHDFGNTQLTVLLTCAYLQPKHPVEKKRPHADSFLHLIEEVEIALTRLQGNDTFEAQFQGEEEENLVEKVQSGLPGIKKEINTAHLEAKDLIGSYMLYLHMTQDYVDESHSTVDPDVVL